MLEGFEVIQSTNNHRSQLRVQFEFLKPDRKKRSGETSSMVLDFKAAFLIMFNRQDVIFPFVIDSPKGKHRTL